MCGGWGAGERPGLQQVEPQFRSERRGLSQRGRWSGRMAQGGAGMGATRSRVRWALWGLWDLSEVAETSPTRGAVEVAVVLRRTQAAGHLGAATQARHPGRRSG